MESRTTVWGFKITIINDNFHLILGHGKKNVQNPDDTDNVKSIYSHIADILFSQTETFHVQNEKRIQRI